MARHIDYGHHIDQQGFERQLTKELEQVVSWVCQVTDMDTTEALQAMQDGLKVVEHENIR